MTQVSLKNYYCTVLYGNTMVLEYQQTVVANKGLCGILYDAAASTLVICMFLVPLWYTVE